MKKRNRHSLLVLIIVICAAMLLTLFLSFSYVNREASRSFGQSIIEAKAEETLSFSIADQQRLLLTSGKQAENSENLTLYSGVKTMDRTNQCLFLLVCSRVKRTKSGINEQNANVVSFA